MEHDKRKTCKGCPDRTLEPNCHDDCDGYKWRIAENEKKKAAIKKDAECLSALIEGVERTKSSENSKKAIRRKNDR